jgi:hypothetical protein
MTLVPLQIELSSATVEENRRVVAALVSTSSASACTR